MELRRQARGLYRLPAWKRWCADHAVACSNGRRTDSVRARSSSRQYERDSWPRRKAFRLKCRYWRANRRGWGGAEGMSYRGAAADAVLGRQWQDHGLLPAPPKGQLTGPASGSFLGLALLAV